MAGAGDGALTLTLSRGERGPESPPLIAGGAAMAESARVHSIETIKDFRAVLCEFGEEVQQALGAVDMEIRRATEWLKHDRLMYWQREIRRRDQQLAQAKSDLHRKNLSRAAGYVPDVSEQKEALRLAQHRLREAELKVEKVRKWAPALQHAVSEYQGQARPLGDMMAGELAQSLALLDRMADALDAYVSMAPPTASRRDPAGSASVAAESSSTAAAAAPGETAPSTDATPEPQEGEEPASGPPVRTEGA
jgi:hypothetical protein